VKENAGSQEKDKHHLSLGKVPMVEKHDNADDMQFGLCRMMLRRRSQGKRWSEPVHKGNAGQSPDIIKRRYAGIRRPSIRPGVMKI